MNITIHDPDPGRCPNLRHSRFHPGTYLRCLDYANTPHVCSFEAEVAPLVSTQGAYSISPPQPKPWVKPGDALPREASS